MEVNVKMPDNPNEVENMEMRELISSFFGYVTENNGGVFPVYNEASMQYELGMYLKERLAAGYRVDFERNVRINPVNALNPDARDHAFVKKEMDLFVYVPDGNGGVSEGRACAIELKYPRVNDGFGAYPEKYVAFTKDIRFMEQVHDVYGIDTYCVTMASYGTYYLGQFVNVADLPLYEFYRRVGLDADPDNTDNLVDYAYVEPAEIENGADYPMNRWLQGNTNFQLARNYDITWNRAVYQDGNGNLAGINQTDGFEGNAGGNGQNPVYFYLIAIEGIEGR